jgi:glycosyltransferase involved in cell wall biosynthesis
MKEGYIPKEQRKRILLLTDDIRFPSGVGTIGKELVIHTAHHYNWHCIGAGINHPDKGKLFDLSQEINTLQGINDAEVIIRPNDGYGDPRLIRSIMKDQQIDAIFLITDPRYFTWLFQIENEIRSKIPIVYLNIWDDFPAPMYNKEFYESCDTLLGISKQTVLINELVLGDKASNKIIEYVPHGLNSDIFKPIDKTSDDYINFRKEITQGKDIDFILFFNSRNIRRKQIPDTMLAWKYFLDQLPKEKADKCLFLLHTEISSEAGTDLHAVSNVLFGENSPNIRFSTSKLSTAQLNLMYNIADAQILLTSNEGWGLSLTEALLTGTPIIANVTGGMQDQMRFEDYRNQWFTPSADIPSNHTGAYKKHGKWAFPVYPVARSLKGSVPTPYIWDDICKAEDATERIMELYKMGAKERERIGLEGYKWATSDEAGFTSGHMAQRVINYVDKTFNTFQPREKFEFINTEDYKAETVPHKLLY